MFIILALIPLLVILQASPAPSSFPRNLKRDTLPSSLTYLTLSQQIFNAQNRARTNPKSFAQELRDFGDIQAANIAAQAPKLDALKYVGGLRKSAAAFVSVCFLILSCIRDHELLFSRELLCLESGVFLLGKVSLTGQLLHWEY